jgi:hypothetical protein
MKASTLGILFGAGIALAGALVTAESARADTICPWSSTYAGGYLGGMDCVDPSNRWLGMSMYLYSGTGPAQTARWGGSGSTTYYLQAQVTCSNGNTYVSSVVTNPGTQASKSCPFGTTVLSGGGYGRVL